MENQSCALLMGFEGTYNNQQVTPVRMRTHWTILETKRIINIELEVVTQTTHPLFGPFGATIGNTMPTIPKITVNTMNGKAPILVDPGY